MRMTMERISLEESLLPPGENNDLQGNAQGNARDDDPEPATVLLVEEAVEEESSSSSTTQRITTSNSQTTDCNCCLFSRLLDCLFRKRRTSICVVLILVLLGLCWGIYFGIHLQRKHDENDNPSFSPSSAPTYDDSSSQNLWKPLGQEISGSFPLGRDVSLSADGNKFIAKDWQYRQENGGWKYGVTQYRYDKITKEWVWSWGLMGWDTETFMHAVASDGGTSASCYNHQVTVYDTSEYRNKKRVVVSQCTRVSSLAISSDGLVVAAAGTQAVNVYQFDYAWKPMGSFSNGAYPTAVTDVTMSSDGKIVAAGAPSSSSYGQVVVKQFHTQPGGGEWQQLGQVFKGSESGDLFGTFVSLSADGKTLAVGAQRYVRIYKYINNNWREFGEFKKAGILQSMSLSLDGNVVAFGTSPNLSVRVHKYSAQTDEWKQMGQELKFVGFSVALSADGTRLAVGGPVSPSDNINDKTNGRIQIFSLEEA